MPVEFNQPDDLKTDAERQAYRRGWEDRVKAVARNWGKGKSDKKAASSRRNGFQPGWRKKMEEQAMVNENPPGLDVPTGNSDTSGIGE